MKTIAEIYKSEKVKRLNERLCQWQSLRERAERIHASCEVVEEIDWEIQFIQQRIKQAIEDEVKTVN